MHGIGYDKTGETSLLTKVGMVGSVFYVDTAANGGSDTNGGLSPSDPLLKINAAMTLCTANKGDVIQVLGNSPSAPNDTATITMDKAGVTLRGLYGKGLLSDSGFGSPTQNVACITIAASFVTIEDLYLGIDVDGSTGGIVEFSGTNSYSGVTFRNILFDTQYIAAYGIYAVYDQPYLLVEDCTFGRSDIAGYTTAGIYLGNGTAAMIRDNTFVGVNGVAVSLGTNCGNVSVLRNVFGCDDSANGEAITAGTSSVGNLIVDNVAANGMLSAGWTYNPYRDLATNTANHWARNWRGNAIVEPVGV